MLFALEFCLYIQIFYRNNSNNLIIDNFLRFSKQNKLNLFREQWFHVENNF